MQMVQLLYCSRSINEITDADIESIINASQKNNAANKVTGALCNNEQYYLQLLEGEYRAVNDTYNKIVVDQRHESVSLILYCDAESRLFSEWSMLHIRDGDYMNELIRKYVEGSSMLELELFGRGCLKFLSDRSKNLHSF